MVVCVKWIFYWRGDMVYKNILEKSREAVRMRNYLKYTAHNVSKSVYEVGVKLY